MARIVKELTDMEIDEISLVDRPANAHASVVIAKRDTQEDTVPDVYDENGEVLEEINEGDVVFDEDGQAFVVVAEEEQPELETVGKRDEEPRMSFADELREELSKSLTNIERDEVVSKAMGKVDEMAAYAHQAEEIAKSERDLRLTREYEEVAKNYNLPVESSELAPVLYAIAEHLPYEYGAVIHKALSAAGEILFEEMGTAGYASNNDVLSAVDSFIDENVSKADISKAEAVEAVFSANPDAYDEYMATRYGS